MKPNSRFSGTAISLFVAIAANLVTFAASTAIAQECKYRGELDTMYCDENRDLVADTPKDARKLKNPNTIVFTYTPVEDPAVYEKVFAPFTEALGKCLAKKVVFYQVQSNAAEIEAMRSGRLHVGGFSTGPTAFAVNLAGAVPFAVKGDAKEYQGYNLIVIVKKTSPFMKLADLKGKKFAHTAPSSNSGHMAPMALFPAEGLAPEKDYKILFSGKHDQSVMGVNSGDYDAAGDAKSVRWCGSFLPGEFPERLGSGAQSGGRFGRGVQSRQLRQTDGEGSGGGEEKSG